MGFAGIVGKEDPKDVEKYISLFLGRTVVLDEHIWKPRDSYLQSCTQAQCFNCSQQRQTNRKTVIVFHKERMDTLPQGASVDLVEVIPKEYHSKFILVSRLKIEVNLCWPCFDWLWERKRTWHYIRGNS